MSVVYYIGSTSMCVCAYVCVHIHVCICMCACVGLCVFFVCVCVLVLCVHDCTGCTGESHCKESLGTMKILHYIRNLL